jgi:hypothetical protein
LKHRLKKPTSAQIQKAFPKNTRDIFEHSDKLILLSLEGHKRYGTHLLSMPNFHDFAILGQTEIKDKSAQQRIRAIYDDGIIDKGFSAVCFNPRHGLRAVKNGQVLDIVICFQCAQQEMYLNNKNVAGSHFGSTHQPELDAILSNANVTLASSVHYSGS